jgi:hypothetical protein
VPITLSLKKANHVFLQADLILLSHFSPDFYANSLPGTQDFVQYFTIGPTALCKGGWRVSEKDRPSASGKCFKQKKSAPKSARKVL